MHFVFRVELDEDSEAHALSGHGLAARLSYFLWSSTPDDALGALADDGSLSQPDVLRGQVVRMLKMDPIGFGLENYDAIGAYRTKEGATPIDSTGALPDGSQFSGSKQLAALIAEDARFPRCMVQKLFTYALGRAPSSSKTWLDGDTLNSLVERFEAGFDFDALITDIVTSEPFLARRGEP